MKPSTAQDAMATYFEKCCQTKAENIGKDLSQLTDINLLDICEETVDEAGEEDEDDGEASKILSQNLEIFLIINFNGRNGVIGTSDSHQI